MAMLTRVRVRRLLGAGISAILLHGAAGSAAEPTDAVLYRIFLNDGSSLVSYGEYVRLTDRVVFSLPLGQVSANPKLQLVTIPNAHVNWVTTDGYAQSARYERYVATRAEADFAVMSSDVARVLNEIALTPDPQRRLEIAEKARVTLQDFPRTNFGYRSADIRQIVGLLDEVVTELRIATGVAHFDLSFVAMAEPPPLMPLLPAPSLLETIEQAVLAARYTDAPAERLSLLQSAMALLDESAATLPAAWVKSTRAAAASTIAEEMRVESLYAALSKEIMARATERAAAADVRGVEAIVRQIPSRDAALGKKRPQVVTALRLGLEAKLDAARRLRLTRDQWMLRRAAYDRYERATREPMQELAAAVPVLDDIKALAGPDRDALGRLERRIADAIRQIGGVTVPPGLRQVHAALVSAFQFADSAARIRSRAVASGDLLAAWDASSAAAASMMLLTQVREDLERLRKIPELR